MADVATLSVLLQLRDQATGALERAKERINATAADIRKTGLIMVGVGGAISAAFGLMAKSALDEEIGIRRLEMALKIAKVSYDEQKEAIEGVIAALQRKTNYADDQQREALQKLVLISGDYKLSLEALPTTLDLATGLNIDLASAATLVGKALAGQTETLSRYGILLAEGATKTEILAAMTAQFGGMAAAAANPLTQIKNQLSDLMEKIGAGLLPIIKSATEILGAIIQKFSEWAGAHPKLAQVITIVIAGLGALSLALGTLALALPVITAAIGAFGVALTLATGPVGIIAVAVAGITAALGFAISKWGSSKKVIDEHTVALRENKSAHMEVEKAIEKTSEKIGGYTALIRQMKALEKEILKEPPPPLQFPIGIRRAQAAALAEATILGYTKRLEELIQAQPPVTAPGITIPVFEVPDIAAEMEARVNQPLQAMIKNVNDFFTATGRLGMVDVFFIGISQAAAAAGISVEQLMALRLAEWMELNEKSVLDLANSIEGGTAMLGHFQKAGFSLGEQWLLLNKGLESGILAIKGLESGLAEVQVALPKVSLSMEGLRAAGLNASQALELMRRHISDQLLAALGDFATKVTGGKELLSQMEGAGLSLRQQFVLLTAQIGEGVDLTQWEPMLAMLDELEKGLVKVEVQLPKVSLSMERLEAAGLNTTQALDLMRRHISDQLLAALADLATKIIGGSGLLNQMEAAGLSLRQQFVLLIAQIGEGVDLSQWDPMLAMLDELEKKLTETGNKATAVIEKLNLVFSERAGALSIGRVAQDIAGGGLLAGFAGLGAQQAGGQILGAFNALRLGEREFFEFLGVPRFEAMRTPEQQAKVSDMLRTLAQIVQDARDYITRTFGGTAGTAGIAGPFPFPGSPGGGVPGWPGMAMGGSVLSPGLALVGERGPELVALPRAASVAPLAARGGDITVVIENRGVIGVEDLDKYILSTIRDARRRGSFDRE